MLAHEKAHKSEERFKILAQGKKYFATSGLVDLDFQLKNIVNYPLYSFISVDLNAKSNFKGNIYKYVNSFET